MSEDNKVETLINEKRRLIARLDKLEVGFILLINQLRSLNTIPQELLDTVEKIILNKGDK
jgi:hypothetical protein